VDQITITGNGTGNLFPEIRRTIEGLLDGF
jgi:hypothetical protein